MLKLREAEIDDWARLFTWRNDAQARASFLSTEPVALNEHMAWLKKTLQPQSPYRLFVACDDASGAHVGTARLDRVRQVGNNRPVYEISLTVDERHRGRGYAQAILGELVHLPGVKGAVLRAVVREDNLASLRLFAFYRFRPKAPARDGLVTLERAE